MNEETKTEKINCQASRSANPQVTAEPLERQWIATCPECRQLCWLQAGAFVTHRNESGRCPGSGRGVREKHTPKIVRTVPEIMAEMKRCAKVGNIAADSRADTLRWVLGIEHEDPTP